jgi:hypothetical protein
VVSIQLPTTARRQIADDNYAPVIGNELFEA